MNSDFWKFFTPYFYASSQCIFVFISFGFLIFIWLFYFISSSYIFSDPRGIWSQLEEVDKTKSSQEPIKNKDTLYKNSNQDTYEDLPTNKHVTISCEKERERVLELKEIWLRNNKTTPNSLVLVPECTSDGQYKIIQCEYEKANSCWCVNPITGKGIRDTWVSNGKPLSCPGLISTSYSYHHLYNFNSRYRNPDREISWKGCKSGSRFIRKFNKIMTDTVQQKKEKSENRQSRQVERVSREPSPIGLYSVSSPTINRGFTPRFSGFGW